jgi:hypothetical protein
MSQPPNIEERVVPVTEMIAENEKDFMTLHLQPVAVQVMEQNLHTG